MNKSELVKAISEKTEASKKDTEASLNAFIEVVTDELKKGEKIQLVGFGTFETRKRAERKGKNPQTGEELVIPACIAPAFKPGKAFHVRVFQLYLCHGGKLVQCQELTFLVVWVNVVHGKWISRYLAVVVSCRYNMLQWW